MTYNNIKKTDKRRIIKVTMDTKWHGGAEDDKPTLFWRLHTLQNETFAVFQSKNPHSSWKTVKDANLADEFESFREEYKDQSSEESRASLEPFWEVDWIIQVVSDQLHPKYMRIVDIRESGNG